MEISDLCAHPKKRLFAVFPHFSYPGLEGLIGNALILHQELKKPFASVLVKRFEVKVNLSTYRGPEQITQDIPNIPQEVLEYCLDKKGIVREGTHVNKGDILVGKITNKEEREYSVEEKRLQAIFGEKAQDAKDSSERWPYEDEGLIIKKSVEEKNKVVTYVKVDALIERGLKIGDLLKDPKGNKGVVVGFYFIPCHYKGNVMAIDVIGSKNSDFISGLEEPAIKNVWLEKKLWYLYDKRIKSEKQVKYLRAGMMGRLSKKSYTFLGKATVGYLTLEKLTNYVEEKINARARGHYFILNNQPLLYDPITDFKTGIIIDEKKISALKNYPEIIKEAVVLRSDVDKKVREKIYEALIKNGNL